MNLPSKAASDEVIEHLQALMFVFRKEMRRTLRDAGHEFNGMEVRVFLRIAEQAGCTSSDLVRESGRNKAQITRLTQQLEQAGLITREADVDDRRIQRLHVTEKGAKLRSDLQQKRQEIGHHLLANLDPGEQRQLAALLERMRGSDGRQQP